MNPRAGFKPAYSLSRGAPSASWVLPQILIKLWRREWDSNPRTLSRRRFSRPVPSTARTSLHEAAGGSVIQALVYDTIKKIHLSIKFLKPDLKFFRIFLKKGLHFVSSHANIYKLTSISQQQIKHPGVAQLVAHLTGGQGVVSSSLATRTKQ